MKKVREIKTRRAPKAPAVEPEIVVAEPEIKYESPDATAAALALVGDLGTGVVESGTFPELWSGLRDSLERELEIQRVTARETVALVRATTDLMSKARSGATDNLLKLVSDLESAGLITVPKA